MFSRPYLCFIRSHNISGHIISRCNKYAFDVTREIIIYKDILFQRPSSRLLRIVTTIGTFATFKHVHLFRTRIECYLDVRHLLVSNATPPPQLREHWPSSDHGPQSPLSELLLSRYTWYSGINPELLNVVFHCCRLCRPCRRRCWKLQLINARNLQNKKLSFFKTRYFYNPLVNRYLRQYIDSVENND